MNAPAGAGPGRKDDTGKQRWDLLPFGVITLVVQVMTFGAAKYEANNWQKVLCSDGRYFAALMRHLVAWRIDPKAVDPESGLLHLAHALCCLVFITSRAIGFDRILDAAPVEELRRHCMPYRDEVDDL